MGSKSITNFPFEIRRINEAETAEVLKYVEGGNTKYLFRVGPHGYFFTDNFEPILPQVYNFEVRPDDVFVATIPKSGTTLTQELVWMIANNCDYERAKNILLIKRFPFLEGSLFIDKYYTPQGKTQDKSRGGEWCYGQIANGPSPRFIKTHQPFSLLPPDILDKSKVVYVARDPRDVAVSNFYQRKSTQHFGFNGDFKDFWELFKRDLCYSTPFFSQFKEAWALKDHPNMLFLFYEEICKDMPAAIRRVAKFLGKTVTEEQVAGLCEHLKFENFKNNDSVNQGLFDQFGIIAKGHLVRKGKVGGWRDYFDEEMAKDAERWMEEGLRGTDFKFEF